MTWRAPPLRIRSYKKHNNFNIYILILTSFRTHISFSLKPIMKYVSTLNFPWKMSGCDCLRTFGTAHEYIYCANSKDTHNSCVCFQHAKHDQTFYLLWYLHVEIKHMTCVYLCYLYNIAIPICNTKQYIYKTKYAPFHYSRTYTNIYMYTLVSEVHVCKKAIKIVNHSSKPD